MFNLTKKEDLTTDEKRALHMLHFDGEKRFTITFPDKEMESFDEFDDALFSIGHHYGCLMKKNPSLATILDINDRHNEQYDVYDNLAQDYFDIKFSDLNMFLLMGKILEKTCSKEENNAD
nr:hypothetical protein [uncultured Ruminococcus sp.]